MPSAASAAPHVTQKPQTNTGICGYWSSLYVGVISSSVTANRRTRATSHSPSTPAAASAGSGRCQNSSKRSASSLSFFAAVVRSAPTIPSTISKRADCFNPDRWACHRAATTQLRCRECLRLRPMQLRAQVSIFQTTVATVCAPDDISVTCSTLEAECDCGFLANETERAAQAGEPGLLCTLRPRCNLHGHCDVSALSLASWLGTRRIARRRAFRHTSAATLVATQSLQRTQQHALPQQRSAARRRNFALDLPLVAYPTRAEYEQ
jgi:hypothetical protein